MIRRRLTAGSLDQERIVLAIAVAIFLAAAVGLQGFLAPGNLIAVIRSVSVIGILAIGMAIVIIGRGIDLSMVAVMALSVAWFLQLLNDGVPTIGALLAAAGAVVAVGLVNGFLVAYAEVPAVFATLATGSFVYGFGRSQLITQDIVYLPPTQETLAAMGQVRVGIVPLDVLFFAVAAFLAFLALRFTKYGRFVYFMGDSFLAARNMGIPVRPLIVGQYVVSALLAFFAGVITAASLLSMNTRIVNSTTLYDVILVVVISGIGLSGGKGGMRNVIVGALLIGLLLNVMTIIDIPTIYQNLIKSVILLVALVIDSLLNPRDEQTAQQGDI